MVEDDWYGALAGLTLGRMLTRKAERNGDKPALKFLADGRALTYRELEDAANRLANGLKAAGYGRGSHIALLTDNRLEQVIAYFGLAKIGAVAVPVNTAAKGYFLERFVGHSDSTAIIAEPALLESLADVADALPALDTLILFEPLDGAPAGIPASLAGRRRLSFDELMRAPADLVDDAEPLDLAQILYTSGTTGPSKGNMFCHRALLNWAWQMSTRQELTAEDTYICVFPLFHGGGWLNATLSTLWMDGTVAIGRKFSASQFLDQARACGATKAIMIAVASFLAARPPSPADRDHKLKHMYGAPPPPDLEGFERRFGVKLIGGYGLTDYGTSHYERPSDLPKRRGSVGKPYPLWRAKVVDEEGREKPVGQAGEILLHCDVPAGTATGYYKMPEATLEARRDLWHHTGDMGYLDEDGNLFFVDRKKDAIRRRGENISSLELEMVLRRHQAVADAAFFPVKASEEDDVAVAIILQQGETITEAEIVAYCQRHMPKFAVPRYVRVLDSFPMTASGKVQKQAIREETEKTLSAVWDREAVTD